MMDIKKHYIHNVYMAQIANCIVNDGIPLCEGANILFSDKAEYQAGVKEIVGLYLLIPYINNKKNQLKYDQHHEQVRIYSDDDIAFKDIQNRPITIKNLRDTICHSFVSCELLGGELPLIIFDDRIIMTKNEHDKRAGKEGGGECVMVRPEDVQQFLKEAFEKVLD